jgi:hypothetical protein
LKVRGLGSPAAVPVAVVFTGRKKGVVVRVLAIRITPRVSATVCARDGMRAPHPHAIHVCPLSRVTADGVARTNTHPQRACSRNMAPCSRPKRGGASHSMQRRAIAPGCTVGVVVGVLFARAHEGLGVVARPGFLVGMHVCRWLPLPEAAAQRRDQLETCCVVV